MTPQEKAKELVDKFTVVGLQQRNEGIQCALICVDEIIAELDSERVFERIYFWNEVKQEIQKL
jgi:hypothetical protein